MVTVYLSTRRKVVIEKADRVAYIDPSNADDLAVLGRNSTGVSDLPQGRTLVCLAGIERKPLAVFDAALVVGYTID